MILPTRCSYAVDLTSRPRDFGELAEGRTLNLSLMSVRARLRAFHIPPFSLPLLLLAPVLCLPFLSEDILMSVFDAQPLVFPLGVQQALARGWVFPGGLPDGS